MSLQGVRLAAVTGHLPTTTVTNASLVARGMDTSDEWIVARTGIRSRRQAAPEESVIDMGVSAGAKAIATAGIDAAEIDLVILATCTLPYPIPGGAAQIAEKLGSANAGVFNLNAGCSGTAYALATASDAVRAGSARSVLVVGSEKLSDWVDQDDRSTAIIFGDGAGAFVVTAAEDPERRDIGPVVWGHKGAAGDAITVDEGTQKVTMDGQAVFRWATTELAPVARRACEKAGIAIEELAGFVPHQANLRIIDSLVRSLRIDESKTAVARHVEHTGNTSAASIPLALASLIDTDRLPSGSPVLVIGFGAGLSYAAQVVLTP